MSIKPKTLRRLLLLGAVVAIIALGGTGSILLRNYQRTKGTQRLRVQGIAAFDRQDYPTAVDQLGRYLGRNESDPEILLRYARARLALEEADGRHLTESLNAFKKYLALRPEDHTVLRETLDVYLAAGLLQEAIYYSQKLLPDSLANTAETDLPVLRIRGAAMLALRPMHRDTPDVLARIVALAPLDVEWQLRYASVLTSLGRTSDVRDNVANLAASSPSDPRTRLVALLAPLGGDASINEKETFPKLCELAGMRPGDAFAVSPALYPDAPYALRLADSFDRLGRFEHSLVVLDTAFKTVQSPELQRTLALRFWQVGRPEDCIRVVGNLPASARGKDIDLLALKALSLKQLKRADEAAAIRDALATREQEFRARAWADAIEAYLPAADADLLDLDRRISSAALLLPGDPLLPFIHAEVLASLGRTDEAISQWKASSRSLQAQGWAMPWIRLSQASLQSGDIRTALDQSTMAIAQAPRALQAGMARFSALVALAVSSNGNRPELAELLAFADAITAAADRLTDQSLARDLKEEVAVSRVLLLLRAGQRSTATQSVQTFLDATTPPSRRALERLALASALEELGLEEQIVARIEKVYGQAPSTAAVRAATLRLAGRKDEGFTLLRSGADGANAPDRLAWDIQIATFLEAANDPAAGPAWISLADSNPTNVTVQRAALSSSIACQDEAFVDRATKRFTDATGAGTNNELLLRVARIRSRLTPQMSTLRRDEVITDLRSVVLDRPSLIDARILLADVLLMNDPARSIQPDQQSAIVELRAAAQASGNPQLRLRVAALLQEQRNFSGARSELISLWKDRKGDAALGRRIADLLAAQGDNNEAIPVWRDLVEADGPNAAPALLIAAGSVLASTAPDEATTLLTRAANHPAIRLDQLPEIAAALTRLAQSNPSVRTRAAEASKAAVARLDSEPSSGRRAILNARYFELTGQYPEAIQGYEQAIKSDRSLFVAWSGLLDACLHMGNVDAARQILDRVTAAMPNEPDLRLLKQRLLLASGTSNSDDLRVLADLLAADPARASEAQAVRAVDDLQRQNKLDDPAALQSLAQKYQGNLAIQLFVARRLMSLTPPLPDEASRIASRAMTAFPADADSARLAAQIFVAQGRWSQAVSACRAWKDRDPSSTMEPDIAIAQAYLALQRPVQAADQIRPYLPLLLRGLDRDDRLSALATFTRAELAAGNAPAALAALQPAIESSATFRNVVWLRLAASDTAVEATASSWIESARRSMNESNPDDAVALASAWSTLAERFPESQNRYAQRALSTLEPLATSSPTAPILELLGATYQRAGQPEQAAAAFRRAIAADPNRASALANLAELLASIGQYDEAVRLTDRALRIAGDTDPTVGFASASVLHRIGLARFDEGLGEPLLARAASIAKQLALRDMGNLSALAAYAQTAADVGDFLGTAEANSLILDLPNLPTALRHIARNNLAFALARAQTSKADLARAETIAREVHDARKDDASLQTLGTVLAAQGRLDEANTIFRTLVAKDPQNSAALLALASSLAQGPASQRQEAIETIRKVSGLNATNPLTSPQAKRDLSHLRGRLIPSSQVESKE